MNSNFGVFAASDWLPVIFRSNRNAFSINQLANLLLYRSLRVGVGIGRTRKGRERAAWKEKKDDGERCELKLCIDELGGDGGVLRFADVIIRECPVWGLSTPPSASGVRRCAWGSSGV